MLFRSVASGDIRKVDIALRWNATIKHRTLKSENAKTERFTNIFDATRRLIQGKPDTRVQDMPVWDWWAHNAEERDIHLLQHHLPTYSTNLDTMADGMEILSVAESSQPERFDRSQLPYNVSMASLSLLLNTRTQDVQPLVPPAPIRANLDCHRYTSASCTSWTPTMFADVPSALRDQLPGIDPK